jgi:N-acyl-D-amino-acid deacylase
MHYDILIRDALIFCGTGAPPVRGDLAILGDRIAATGDLASATATTIIDAAGQALSPGFIDAHTHDDTNVISMPEMLPKISQGVTTVITGNCGISAAPVRLRGDPPDPMNLLGEAASFRYPRFADYAAAVGAAQPAVNVAALVGHTALRSNHMDRFDRAATAAEIHAMRLELRDALAHGALGLSTGLAYINAINAPTSEVADLAEELTGQNALYATHLRSEREGVLDAMSEAFQIGRHARAPVIVSHLKCAGVGNWGKSGAVLEALDAAAATHPVWCDCYPYAASASTIDVQQCSGEVAVKITWSKPEPGMAGRWLADIAAKWGISQPDAARRLQPGGAIYESMDEADVERILAHRETMIGSDGLPNDPLPHPRLWGSFPRVLGHYSRDRQLFSLAEAIRKMTTLPAARFRLHKRGKIEIGFAADLVLFDPTTIRDTATFSAPHQAADGILAVWVNGVLTYHGKTATGQRAGRFLPRNP